MKIIHKQNNTIDWMITYTDGFDVPISLDGYTIRCQAKTKYPSLGKTPFFDLTIGDGIEIIDSEKGVHSIITNTLNMDIDFYSVDIQYTKDGKVLSTKTFEVEVINSITKIEIRPIFVINDVGSYIIADNGNRVTSEARV